MVRLTNPTSPLHPTTEPSRQRLATATLLAVAGLGLLAAPARAADLLPCPRTEAAQPPCERVEPPCTPPEAPCQR